MDISMSYDRWHQQVIKKVGPVSEFQLYVRTLILGFALFALFYWYTTWLKIPNPLNKAVADTSIVLIGLSMLLSSLCYFWNFVDTKIVYRKQLGLMGLAFGLVHVGLSFSTLQKLFMLATWQQGTMWPALTGALAVGIFACMAFVSNQYAANVLGGKAWRKILRTGYIAVLLIFAHVYLLKSVYIIRWYTGGMKTPPSTSLLVLAFMTIVIVMRVALWWSLKTKSVRS